MHPKLAQLKNVMEDFQKTYPEDACLYLGDTEEIIKALPGETFDLNIKTGTTMAELEGRVTQKALKTGKILREEREADVFGIAYISTAYPIYDGEKVIGVLAAVISNQKVDTMRTSSNELGDAVQEVSSTAAEMLRATDDVATRLQELSEQAEAVNQEIENINEILSLVKGIARQSNILGLNASIEAARSGQHGKGFSVVATEIRKLAENSDQSVSEVESQLEVIKQAVEKMSASTNQIAAFTEEHNASMQEMSATYQRIEKMAEDLMHASQISN